jgi:hypothetical protein
MARYKAIDSSPRFLAVDLEKHLLPGSFKHTVHHLLDHEFDLSLFARRETGLEKGFSTASTVKANRPCLHRGDVKPRKRNEEKEQETMQAGSGLSGGLGSWNGLFIHFTGKGFE